ncbi:T9SS type A sorting domain-containing protein [Adhaeribacter sp. BT258]|uniref:T9SS type A sorting domain-containing protein n=1 Tax=Adhaeribacter terrigena TaxID=2793070 RepID=A0ABS1C2E4_9BACT|nr:T9SS type A sorting domain-containing protein [Adhaeribacter terrigena]MBK0403311.1 T9SS type A sorting domain-containing protein [Adhaeribacter terrigena]
MKKTLLLACAFALGAKGFAQTYAPVPLTGFNADIVANGSGTVASSTSIDLDGASFNFVAQNFINPSGQSPTSALPNSGTITSAVTSTPGLTYQLAPYTGNNSLRISAPGTGTLTFPSPQSADQVFLLLTSGSGISTVTATVNFTDATTQVFPGLSVSDWFSGSGYAIQGISRVSRATDQIENSSINPRLYQTLLTLSTANAGKSIQSIHFNKTSTTGVLNVMGVSIRTVASTLAADAGIIAITAPNSGCALTNQETITVTVKNHGTTAQSNIPVSYKINNGTPVNEIMAGPLAPNTSASYSFITKANLSTTGTYSLEARTNLTGDLAPTNDALTRSIVLSAAPAAPTISAGGTTTICTGGSVMLTAASATTGATYQWFNNGTAIANATAATYNATAAGSYTVVADITGCSSAASAATVVTMNTTPPAPGVNAGGPTSICTGGSVTLTAVSAIAGATFTWFLDGNLIPGATSANYTATTGGSYAASATAGGCSSPTSLGTTVSVKQKPTQPIVTQTGNLLNSSSTTGNQWFKNGTAIPGATAQVLNVSSNGAYTVKVTANGCTSDASNAVTITNTGISDDKNNLAVTVFPNPAAGLFNLILPEGKSAAITVTDLTGKLILQKNLQAENTQLNLNQAAKGIYLLHVKTETGTAIRKLIVE